MTTEKPETLGYTDTAKIAAFRLRALADWHEQAGTALQPHEMRTLAAEFDALADLEAYEEVAYSRMRIDGTSETVVVTYTFKQETRVARQALETLLEQTGAGWFRNRTVGGESDDGDTGN